MKFVLRFLASIAFLLLVTSCSDDPVTSGGSHATPSYHASLLSLDTGFGGVCGTGPKDVYAFGSAVLHYDGERWNTVALPSNAGTLLAAAGFPDGAIAVSDGRNVYVRKGEEWSWLNGQSGWVDELWGSSSTDIYAISYDGMDHFDGSSWSPVALPGELDWPYAMAGRSANDIIAAGRSGAIYRFDGSQWTTIHIDSTVNYNSLAMTESGRTFATMSNRDIVEIIGPTRQVLLHDVLRDPLVCADGDALYAAGQQPFDNYGDEHFLIKRYENDTWDDIVTERGHAYAFWAGTGSIVAAGADNLIWRGTAQGGSLENAYPLRKRLFCAANIDGAIYAVGEGAYRYEHGVWTDLDKEYISANWAFAIAGRNRHDIYAVGDAMVMHYDGEQWTWINAGLGRRLRGAWIDENGDLLACGDSGIILRQHGNTWSTEEIPGHPRYVSALWGVDKTVFAVGSDGLIAMRTNGTWRTMASATNSSLYAIWGFGENRVYAGGANNNELCYYDGRTWQAIPVLDAPVYNVVGIWGTSPADLFVADPRGTIAHFDGRAWTELERVLSGGVNAVCGNGGEALVIEEHGIVSYTR